MRNDFLSLTDFQTFHSDIIRSSPDLHSKNPPADQLLPVHETEDHFHLLAEVRAEPGELDVPAGGSCGADGENDRVPALTVLLVTGVRVLSQPDEMEGRGGGGEP